MLQVFWSEESRSDLRDILFYIALRDPVAARRLHKLIANAILPAAEHPYLFRSGRVPGTREIVAHPNYIVVYRVGNDVIDVLRVLHSRQQYP
jgi:toxin ParE1/3/4